MFHLFLALFTYYTARIGSRDAYDYKKDKRQRKADSAKRPLWKKILGIYSPSNSNAPHHMRKYIIIRFFNMLSLLVGILFYVLHASEWLFALLKGLHFVFLVMPLVYDAFALSSFKQGDDKTLHFDKSRKP